MGKITGSPVWCIVDCCVVDAQSSVMSEMITDDWVPFASPAWCHHDEDDGKFYLAQVMVKYGWEKEDE
jgi:hypothetical protein